MVCMQCNFKPMSLMCTCTVYSLKISEMHLFFDHVYPDQMYHTMCVRNNV